MAVRFQFRRGTTAEWAVADPVLAEGEPGLEQLVDGSYAIKIGDGVTAWSAATYLPLQGEPGDPGGPGDPGPPGDEGPPGEWTQVTQAAYDALSPPDPDILYVIVG